MISRGSAAIFQEDFIDCLADLCQLSKCLASKFDSLSVKAARAGGWSGLSEQDRSNFQYASALVLTAQQMRNCGEYSAAKPYVDKAAEILNCDCGCAENNTPMPLSGAGVVGTDLGYEYSGSSLLLTSSTGDGVELPVADDTHDGLLSSTYKTSVDNSISSIVADVSDINDLISNAGIVGINIVS